MGARVVFAGVVLCVFAPVLAMLGLGSASWLGCSGGGSSGPVSGCHLIGISMNWFVTLATLAFLASFISVPIGVIVLLCGFGILFFESRRHANRPYGIYDARGKLLPLEEGAKVVSRFDRESCNALLRSFGHVPAAGSESLDAVRERATAALKAGSRRAF